VRNGSLRSGRLAYGQRSYLAEHIIDLVRSGRSPFDLAREFEPSTQTIMNGGRPEIVYIGQMPEAADIGHLPCGQRQGGR